MGRLPAGEGTLKAKRAHHQAPLPRSAQVDGTPVELEATARLPVGGGTLKVKRAHHQAPLPRSAQVDGTPAELEATARLPAGVEIALTK